MTEIDALKNCRKMWQYIADNPYFHKFQVIRILWGGTHLLHDCWACEYVKEPVADKEWPWQANCNKCPLWPATKHKILWACELDNSPYSKWLDTKETKYALEIVAMCDEALMKLGAKYDTD